MSDEKNANPDEQVTARIGEPAGGVDELFATKPYEGVADAGAESDGGGETSAAAVDGTAATAATAATASLTNAEPAWLQGWGKTERTTPRIRWGGIVWGLVFAATGWFALWTMLAEDRRAAFSDWILSLENGGWAVVAACAVGGLVLVIGLISGLRAATRRV